MKRIRKPRRPNTPNYHHKPEPYTPDITHISIYPFFGRGISIPLEVFEETMRLVDELKAVRKWQKTPKEIHGSQFIFRY